MCTKNRRNVVDERLSANTMTEIALDGTVKVLHENYMDRMERAPKDRFVKVNSFVCKVEEVM